jgi:uncharacterized protein YjbI with pentapeptide repeats
MPNIFSQYNSPKQKPEQEKRPNEIQEQLTLFPESIKSRQETLLILQEQGLAFRLVRFPTFEPCIYGEHIMSNGIHAPHTDLSGAVFTHSEISNWDLTGSIAQKIGFRNATLTNITFECADLQNANFQDSKVSDSNLCGANLSGANIKNAQFTRIEVNKHTIMPNGIACSKALIDALNSKELDPNIMHKSAMDGAFYAKLLWVETQV